MRIGIDRERCVGSGMCVYALPAVFDQSDEDGRVVLLAAGDNPPRDGHGADPDRALRAAAASCPVAAISLADD